MDCVSGLTTGGISPENEGKIRVHDKAFFSIIIICAALVCFVFYVGKIPWANQQIP